MLNNNVLIIGYGVSGKSACKYYLELNKNVFVFDANIQPCKNGDVTFISILDLEIISKISFAVISPGINSDKDEMCLLCEKNKIKLITEIDVGYLALCGKSIGVTGSNGKTTVTLLLNHMLNLAKKKSVACGNVGFPITSAVLLKDFRTFVVELSSFQLEKSRFIKNDIAIFLNFSEDHLDRHITMQNYFNAKLNIFNNQTNKDFAILNFDDKTVKNIATNSKVVFFSTKEKVKGAYLFENSLWFCKKNPEKICDLNEVNLIGEKNYSNVLACIACAKLLKVKNKTIKSAIKSFYASPNRMEKVFTKKNVTFINDSKATNVDSTIFAISSFNGGIHLLLGGLSKGQDFSKLFMSEYISSVKMFYIYGKDKDIILSAAKNFVEDERLSICKNMADAFFVAEKNCKEGETLLLSPACSSFDEFANYEERGEKFRSLVKEVEDD